MKKRVWKRRKQALREGGYPKSIEKQREWKFCYGELGPFNSFVIMLNTTFSKRRFIKISVTRVYTKPGIKKNDTAAIISATNEVCIGCMKFPIW